MSKKEKVVSDNTRRVGGSLGNLLPKVMGPDWKNTATYDSGKTSDGYGGSRSSARRNSRKR